MLRGLPRPSIHRLTRTVRLIACGAGVAAVDHRVGPSTHAMISKRSRTTLERPCHETRISGFHPRCRRRFLDPGGLRANAQDGQGPRHAVLWGEPGLAWFFDTR